MNTDTEAASPYAQTQQQSIDDQWRCAVPWGLCPEHGPTLRSSAGHTWCTDPVCRYSWDYDRLNMPCPLTATHTVQADEGGRYGVCTGHAIAIRAQIIGGQVLPEAPISA